MPSNQYQLEVNEFLQRINNTLTQPSNASFFFSPRASIDNCNRFAVSALNHVLLKDVKTLANYTDAILSAVIFPLNYFLSHCIVRAGKLPGPEEDLIACVPSTFTLNAPI